METQVIYVELLDEGVDAWRPSCAKDRRNGSEPASHISRDSVARLERNGAIEYYRKPSR